MKEGYWDIKEKDGERENDIQKKGKRKKKEGERESSGSIFWQRIVKKI